MIDCIVNRESSISIAGISRQRDYTSVNSKIKRENLRSAKLPVRKIKTYSGSPPLTPVDVSNSEKK